MRHRKKKNKLKGNYDYRHSLIKNLARDLFLHGKIKTTLPKARQARRLVERAIAKVRRNGLNGRRFLFNLFKSQTLSNQIAESVTKRFAKKIGGVTRVRKLKKRKGDNATIVLLEFVDGQGAVEKKEEKIKAEETREVKKK